MCGTMWLALMFIMTSVSMTAGHIPHHPYHLNQLSLTAQSHNQKSFGIDYDHDTFVIDGKPFRYIGGTMHYFQVPHKYWLDRLTKMRAAGLNVVETYLSWNWHEPEKGQFRWSDDQDVVRFVQHAHELGLYVIMRIGPYMDAEQDMGGFPAWLLKVPNIRLRTNDENYKIQVKHFYTEALAKLKPLLYPNGGPIIMVQVENEYGSFYACDREYTHWLLGLVKDQLATDDILYFTTDGNTESYLKCGVINGTYATVDFGVSDLNGVKNGFAAQRKYSPKGPLVNSEFYPGWFNAWGDHTKSVVPIQNILDTMTFMYQMNASFNLYPFIGGTNFGYQAGAESYNTMTKFISVVTSYDYDAPLTENGDVSAKYFAIRQHIERLTGIAIPYPVPESLQPMYYGRVTLKLVIPIGTLFDMLPFISKPSEVVHSQFPKTVEEIDHYYGFVLYETTAKHYGTVLDLRGVYDRGYVYLNRSRLLTIVQRPNSRRSIVAPIHKGDLISILVENQGRVCYGTYINDTKGIVSNVTLGRYTLSKWSITPLHIEQVVKVFNSPSLMAKLQSRQTLAGYSATEIPCESYEDYSFESSNFVPTFYATSFSAVPRAGDTFLDLTGWGKGHAIDHDGYNLGRYWSDQGPEYTLYHPFVQEGSNNLTLFELDHPKSDLTVNLINYQIWNTCK